MDIASKPPRLLAQVRAAIRVHQLSQRTEQAYLAWVRRYVRFHRLRHPATMGTDEVVAFLSHLATEGRVVQSTQMQALSALLLLYRDVIRKPLLDLRALVRARAPARLPVVLTLVEVERVLGVMREEPWLVALLLYGSGLRLMEALTLRVKDADLERGEIRVRRGKGGKDRVTVLPEAVKAPLSAHLARVRDLYQRDQSDGSLLHFGRELRWSAHTPTSQGLESPANPGRFSVPGEGRRRVFGARDRLPLPRSRIRYGCEAGGLNSRTGTAFLASVQPDAAVPQGQSQFACSRPARTSIGNRRCPRRPGHRTPRFGRLGYGGAEPHPTFGIGFDWQSRARAAFRHLVQGWPGGSGWSP